MSTYYKRGIILNDEYRRTWSACSLPFKRKQTLMWVRQIKDKSQKSWKCEDVFAFFWKERKNKTLTEHSSEVPKRSWNVSLTNSCEFQGKLNGVRVPTCPPAMAPPNALPPPSEWWKIHPFSRHLWASSSRNNPMMEILLWAKHHLLCLCDILLLRQFYNESEVNWLRPLPEQLTHVRKEKQDLISGNS